jgi:plastocyanin
MVLVAGACTSKASPTATAGAGATTTAPSTASPGASNLDVSLANYSFTPSTLSVTSGTTIHLHNTTPATPHTFVVTGQSINISISAGSTQVVTIDLPPGTYHFYCRIHQSLGMTGTLVVG